VSWLPVSPTPAEVAAGVPWGPACPFSGGIFYSPPASGGDGTIYVFGGPTASVEDITGSQIQERLGTSSTAQTFAIPTDATAVDVRNELGQNTVSVDPSFDQVNSGQSLALSVYGGSGSDLITDAGGGNDQLMAGDGTETIIYTGTGTPTMTPGAGNDILSDRDLGDYVTVSGQWWSGYADDYTLTMTSPASHRVSEWTVDWGDGSVPSTASGANAALTNYYAFANGLQPYTVTVTAVGEYNTDGTCTVPNGTKFVLT
jgi:hypothetical protein